MARPAPRHARIFGCPYSDLIFDARIEALLEEAHGQRRDIRDILLDLALLRPYGAPRVELVDGHPWERVRGEYAPHRLRFRRAAWLGRSGPFADLEALPRDADARRLFRIVHLREPARGARYVLVTHAVSAGYFSVRASSCVLEARGGASEPVELLRRWSPSPAPPAGLLPHPARLHARYGGDPIAIRLGRRLYRERLFIGGVRQQGAERPAVDHVVNLSEHPSVWARDHGRDDHGRAAQHPADRHTPKGEMAAGMTADALLEEALWVARALGAGRRVLVHCAAGINRSSTLCCAALMLLEGLTAEDALARVRERHPEADPDPYHWFTLQRLRTLAREWPQESLADATAEDATAEGATAGVAARDMLLPTVLPPQLR
jgi:predicted protein tyrosine phosphatase